MTLAHQQFSNFDFRKLNTSKDLRGSDKKLQLKERMTEYIHPSYNNKYLELVNFRMRPLQQDETKALFEKLANYIGSDNIKRLLQRSEGNYVFR